MFTVERHEGRLVEVHMVTPLTREEIDAADEAMTRFEMMAAGEVAIFADYSRASVLSEEHSEALVGMFRRHNDSIAYSAILVSPQSAVSLLQMERVIREAQNPRRKCFREGAAASDWLTPHLTMREQTRLKQFLTGTGAL